MPKRTRSKSALAYKKRAKLTPNSRAVIMRNPRYTAPAGVQVVLKYHARADLTAGLSSFQTVLYRGAGAFDPEFAVGGHQPLGYDEWAMMYQRYRVLSCKITADYSTGDVSDDMIPFITATETSAGFANADTYIEQPFARKGRIIQTGGGPSGTRLIMNIRTAQFEGDSGALFDKDYTGAIGALPTRDWYYHVGVLNANPALSTAGAFASVVLEYTIRFYDRADMDRS